MFKTLEPDSPQFAIYKIFTNSLLFIRLGFLICKMQIRTPSCELIGLLTHSIIYLFIQQVFTENFLCARQNYKYRNTIVNETKFLSLWSL